MDDAEELERLGHHGISGNLNRDHEADLSIQSEYQNRLRVSSGGAATGTPIGMKLHPMVSLLFGLCFLILGLYFVSVGISNPASRIPKDLQSWSTVIATVEHAVAIPGRYNTKYNMTFLYKVAGKSYWFKEGGVPTEIHLSEVRYDSLAPSHYYRVPLQGEAWSGLLLSGFICLIAYIFIASAVDKWRSGDRSYNLILSSFFLIAVLALACAEFVFCFNLTLQKDGQPKATPYKVATSIDPG